MKKLLAVLFMICVAAMAALAPLTPVTQQKSFSASQDKVFAAMVQAAANYDIKVISREGCLVKLGRMRRLSGLPMRSTCVSVM